MNKSRLLGTLFALAFSANIQIVQAVMMTDQSNIGSVDFGADINECCRYVAQTFTAGVSGNLDGVSVSIHEFGQATGQLRISIFPTQNSLPLFSPLGSTTLPSASSSIADEIAFFNPIEIIEGTLYAIVADYVNAPPAGAYQSQGIWSGSTGDQYTRGQNLAYLDNEWIYDGDGFDTHFVTYATVPSPPTLWLIGIGLPWVIWGTRRKKSA